MYDLSHPPNILLFLKQFIIEPTYTNWFVLLILLDSIILYTSAKNVPSFQMQNHHQKTIFIKY